MVHFPPSSKLRTMYSSALATIKNLLRKFVSILLAIQRCSYALTASSIARIMSWIIASISLAMLSSSRSVVRNPLTTKMSYLKIRVSILSLAISRATSSSTRHTLGEKKKESMKISIPSSAASFLTSTISEINSRKSYEAIQKLTRVFVINWEEKLHSQTRNRVRISNWPTNTILSWLTSLLKRITHATSRG